MKISYNWLKDFIKIDWPAEKIADLLTDLGLEVEGTENFESVKGGLKGIVVGKVLTCKKHPNADRLKITTVDIGNEKPVQIVCGAPNVAQGQFVPVATIGTTLYDKEKGPWEIKKSKIRGEESFGMICAEDELGLGKSHDGIMILKNDLKPGTLLNKVFEVLDDVVFEIGLTPNRSDAMSHYGVARDLRAGLIQQGQNTALDSPSLSNFQVENRSRRISIEVENYELAPRYCGITITDVKVKDSPQWLQNRLKAIGLSPKNNIVDATNYVMHELGQPFHAFDADKIHGSKIIVKTLPQDTKFRTLDDVERKLHAEDLMICDEKGPLCIAGVFGGLHSGVTENTTNIFLESAYFNPVSIRKTAKRHGLSTDASFRFERGIDPNFTDYALKRVALLIKQVAEGKVSSELDDIYPKKIEDFQVFLRYKKIDNLVGQKIDQNILKSILTSLEIRVNNVTESGMGLTIPAFRADVHREVDVIEEILRIYGYNSVDFSEKLNASIAQNGKFEDYKLQNTVAEQLVGQGFYEMMANSLTGKNHFRPEKFSEKHNVELLNPLSQDLAVLRQSLLSGGLESIAFNLNRKNEDLRFFEFGKSYHSFPEGRQEQKHLCLFVTGRQQQENWDSSDQKNGFFFLKGTLNSIFQRFGINVSYEALESEMYAEGLEIFCDKKTLGHFGVLKKATCKIYGIDQETLFANIHWDTVLETVSSKPSPKLKPIPKFPKVRRDFALLLNNETGFSEIENIAFSTEKKLLKNVGLFDVYQGENLPEGKKSYAVSFTFMDEQKTLTDKKIDKVMAKLQKQFETQLDAELR